MTTSPPPARTSNRRGLRHVTYLSVSLVIGLAGIMVLGRDSPIPTALVLFIAVVAPLVAAYLSDPDEPPRQYIAALAGIVALAALAASAALESDRNENAVRALCGQIVTLKQALNEETSIRFRGSKDSCAVDWAEPARE